MENDEPTVSRPADWMTSPGLAGDSVEAGADNPPHRERSGWLQAGALSVTGLVLTEVVPHFIESSTGRGASILLGVVAIGASVAGTFRALRRESHNSNDTKQNNTCRRQSSTFSLLHFSQSSTFPSTFLEDNIF
jgi:hypothetical protein